MSNTKLWINNNEDFYNILINKVELLVYMHISYEKAVHGILAELPDQTPDGKQWDVDDIVDLVDEEYNEQLQYS